MERGRDSVRSLKREARQLASRDICFVCLQPVRGGVYHAWLGCITHLGECQERMRAEYRVYDRSTRGRWRPVGEVLARIKAQRQPNDQ